jgi:ubiquinone biosynthesis protein
MLRDYSRGERLRLALEHLGPPFIKLGQILSTRRDLLPGDIVEALTRLQDDVAPFDGAQAEAIVAEGLGAPVAELFAEIEREPMASASIAQVHAARLHNGQKVAVKVRRPGIERLIRTDLAVMFAIAHRAERYLAEARRLRVVEVVQQFARTIADELDLQKEGAHASQLRRNFADKPILHVPRVHWDHTCEQVLTLDWIDGTPIADRAALRERGVDVDRVSRYAAEVFFRQVFWDGFFHADMHPGNIFVADNGQLQVVDFGIMGVLQAEERHFLADMLLAFLQRDYTHAARVHREAGYVPADTDMTAFEDALRAIAEPILERPLHDISMAHLLIRLFQTTREFRMETQPQLLLLQKTMVNVEGVAREFNPGLNIWYAARPLIREWVTEEKGPGAWLRELKREAPEWGRTLPALPRNAASFLDRALGDDLVLNLRGDQIEDLRREVRRGIARLAITGSGGALLIAAVLAALLPAEMRWGLPAWAPAAVLAGIGAALVLAGLLRR